MEKKLYKSADNYVIGGVAGGLGEYFGIDPTLIRLAFVLFTLAEGSGLIIYIILMVVLHSAKQNDMEESQNPPSLKASEGRSKKLETGEEMPQRKNTLALVLIGVGLAALLNQIVPITWLTWQVFWPALLIVGGIYLMFRR